MKDYITKGNKYSDLIPNIAHPFFSFHIDLDLNFSL